jgi:hypothetical protein
VDNPVNEDNIVAVDGLSHALKENSTQVGLSIEAQSKTLKEGMDSTAKVINKNFVVLTKMVKALSGDVSKVHEVKVKNQAEFPSKMKVEVTNHPKAITDLRVTNSKPSEAIPVRLVNSTGKKFYEALMTAVHDIDLSKTNRLLGEIRDSQGNITLNAGNISLNTDGLEMLLGKVAISVGGNEISSVSGEGDITPWASYTVPVGKTFLIKGVSVTAMGEGTFQLQVNNGLLLWHGVPSWTQRTIVAPIEHSVQSGDFINMHLISNANTLSLYTAQFWGYLITNPI